MEFFPKICNYFCKKISIIDVRQGFKYASKNPPLENFKFLVAWVSPLLHESIDQSARMINRVY